MRSQVPCKLTAAKIMDLSIENFGMVMIKNFLYYHWSKTKGARILIESISISIPDTNFDYRILNFLKSFIN